MTLEEAANILGAEKVAILSETIEDAFAHAVTTPNIHGQRALEIMLIAYLASIIATPQSMQDARSRANLCAKELSELVSIILDTYASSEDEALGDDEVQPLWIARPHQRKLQ